MSASLLLQPLLLVALGAAPETNGAAHRATYDVRAQMNPAQRALYDRLQTMPPGARTRLQLCFASGTPAEVVNAFTALTTPDPTQAAAINRWPGALGSPVHLTYSFVPDGVAVPGVTPLEPSEPNVLFATFDAIFGGSEPWQNLWAQSLQRWSSCAGLNYELVADDGAPLFGSPGSDGRGDVRIAARVIDGPGGILAFNQFPQPVLLFAGGGDMVLDAADVPSWSDAADNHRLLRNVIMHEHGHGIGLLHVCPVNQTKLMEPFASVAFDGPQLDDVRGGQFLYGDRFEPNDTPANATALGAFTGLGYLTRVSTHTGADVDVYSIDAPAGATLTVIVVPIGDTYVTSGFALLDQCFQQQTIEAARIADLSLRLLDSSGTEELASSSAGGLGEPEFFVNAPLEKGGLYYVEVAAAPAPDVQMYILYLLLTPAP